MPSSPDQVARGNFRAYWDGGCKDGFAFGLGRDIAISDTHHYEEITTHSGTGDNHEAVRVNYDYVNNFVSYTVPLSNYPAAYLFYEKFYKFENAFFVSHETIVVDESGNFMSHESSPLRPTRFLLYSNGAVRYRLTDHYALPPINPSDVSAFAETLNPTTGTIGGPAIVRYANGQIRHLMSKGASREAVVLPTEYVSKIDGIFNSVREAVTTAQSGIERARQVEREYLYMACSGKHAIPGLDKETATKICGWRAQFKEPYEKARAQYVKDMEQQRGWAESAAKERRDQQQAATLQQQQIHQQQQKNRQLQMQELQQIANTFGQIGQQFQNTGQQMLNGAANQPASQVNFAPFSPSGGNQVRCVTASIVTNCRY